MRLKKGFTLAEILIVLMVIGALIYRAKVTLTEQEHARIVEELEEKWESMNK